MTTGPALRPLSRPRLTVVDWTSVAREQMDRLYAAEATRWSTVLGWETASGWQEVERGRTLGTVEGAVALDDRGAVAGWCYYLVHDGALQIGACVAPTDAVAQPLVDRMLARAADAGVERITLFAYADAPGLAAMLRTSGLSVDRYWYLARDLRREALPRLADARPWRADDLAATAELFARAYHEVDEARPFAPRGGADAWIDYARQLITGTGCGRLAPDACVAVPGGPNRLLAVAIVTIIAEGTAHLAQIAVDPQLQGKGVGSQLLEAGCALAGRAGAERITLLVGGKNARARAMYEGARFEPRASFVAAGTLQPRRLTRVAPGTTVAARR